MIEVAMPLEAINKASAREKSIRHGHPSTLHLYWARRPLAACRAVLFAQLVDDPSAHPDKFPTEADQQKERERLFGIMEELVIWENSTNDEVLKRAHAEILKSWDGELPPIHDPFSGGGSIPLEAQRLGLPAYGSDLNPVAVMIGKAMIENPPLFKDMKPAHPGGAEKMHYKNAEGLAEDVKYYGEWMRKKAFERIGHLYPQVDLPKEYGGGKGTVIAWIWARTVPSPDPAFSDAQVPLISSFLLSAKRKIWIEPIIDRTAKTISYQIRSGGSATNLNTIKLGTSAGKRQGFRCVMSETAIPYDYIRNAGKSGKLGQSLIAIVAEGKGGRVYMSPEPEHETLALSAQPKWVPETELPKNPRDFKTPNYGFSNFGDLFTDRQLVALNTFSDFLMMAREQIEKDALANTFSSDQTPLHDGGKNAKAYAEAVSVYLSFAINRMANTLCTFSRWTPNREQTVTGFARQAIPMTWDFPEVNPFANAAGDYGISIAGVVKGLEPITINSNGQCIQYDAQTVNYAPNTIISTDPPYYDNIGYADLSDFFFTWMKPTLKSVYPNLFGVLTTPKAEELVATPYRHGGKDEAERFFLDGMSKAIKNMANNSSDAAPATIYYAFKQSEIEQEGISSTGWSTFLQAVIEAGYAVVGTWPMRTEMANRMIASGANALANSVVLVCRKRQESAEEITRAEFVRALKRELPPAIKDLQTANVSAADMPQSAIGPGIDIFSRYKAVLDAKGDPMTVKSALQLINAELDEFLNDLHGDFDPDTRFATTWFEQHGTDKGEYGAADNIARARGISVDSAKHAGIVDSSDGKVRILKRNELDPEWNPETDTHLTIWECCQHLIRVLEKEGEQAAAELLKKMGSANAEQVKDLAYYLYDVCAKKRQDAKEATAYNGLIAVWSELTNLSNKVVLNPEQQTTMDI